MYQIKVSFNYYEEYDEAQVKVDYSERLTALIESDEFEELLKKQYEDFESGLIAYVNFLVAYYKELPDLYTYRLERHIADKLHAHRIAEKLELDEKDINDFTDDEKEELERFVNRMKTVIDEELLNVEIHLCSGDATALENPGLYGNAVSSIISHQFDSSAEVVNGVLPLQVKYDFERLNPEERRKALLYLPVISNSLVGECAVDTYQVQSKSMEYCTYLEKFCTIDEILENIITDAEEEYHTDYSGKKEELKALFQEYLKVNKKSVFEWKYEVMLYPFKNEAQAFAIWSFQNDRDVEGYDVFADEVIEYENGFTTPSVYDDTNDAEESSTDSPIAHYTYRKNQQKSDNKYWVQNPNDFFAK